MSSYHVSEEPVVDGLFLRLTAVLGLLADTVSLLRAHALLHKPSQPDLLHEMLPNQLHLELL